MSRSFRLLTNTLVVGLAAAAFAVPALAEPSKPECIAPAKPGGGFDLTCRLAETSLKAAGVLSEPMRISYMPGGIGAVAYNAIIGQRPDEGGTIVAFSGGSLLNIAQGKFGKYSENDVRWLAGIGADFGAVIVRADAPWKNLGELMADIKADSSKVVFGAGGSVGSQDWMKAALTAKAAGIDYKTMRFVAFEGGGEAMTALQGGHVQVVSGDAAEIVGLKKQGAPVRALAVFAEERLEGIMSDVATAKEQGFDIQWPIIRGFYVGPKVSDADYQFWVEAFDKTMATPEYAALRADRGLFPFSMTGPKFEEYVMQRVKVYREIADSFGLIAR